MSLDIFMWELVIVVLHETGLASRLEVIGGYRCTRAEQVDGMGIASSQPPAAHRRLQGLS